MVDVCFSRFSLRQRVIIMWFIFMGRTVSFQPVKSRTDVTVKIEEVT